MQQIYELSSKEVDNMIVYDIEVDIDHSFAVNDGLIVHNSACTTRFLTGCFAAGTKVNTESGYKNIENIEIGDKVLTHDGSYQKVIKTHNNGKSEELIEVNGIVCTKNHLFYVIDKNKSHLVNNNNIHNFAYWLEAKRLSDDQLIIEISE
jgi:intein/homing endonuclease